MCGAAEVKLPNITVTAQIILLDAAIEGLCMHGT